MTRSLLLAAVFGAGIIIGACSYALLKPRHECPALQTTFKLNDPGHAAFILNSIETLEWQDASGTITQFTPKGRIAASGRNLTIKNNQPVSIPDDHGSSEFMLVEIGENKAKIAYQSEFHHLSFGRNLITVDGGVVELDVRKKGP
jgi:hypothetical protein